MGREVSRSAHRMDGRVFIARPTAPGTILPADLQEKQAEAMAHVNQLKQMTRSKEAFPVIGNIALGDSLSDINEQEHAGELDER